MKTDEKINEEYRGGKPRIVSQSGPCLQPGSAKAPVPDAFDGPRSSATPLFGTKVQPEILFRSPAYLVLYKPPGMHCAPLEPGEKGTLLDFAAQSHPEILAVRGRKACEGGLLHRLDYQTRGLILAACNQRAFDGLRRQQEEGRFVKEYRAVSRGAAGTLPPGFPAFPSFVQADGLRIESAFRAWGRGRAAVRPVTPRKGDEARAIYRTEILSRARTEDGEDGMDGTEEFRLRLTRGFRHQIRCHLAWAGSPIANDELYGGAPSANAEGFYLALTATAIMFDDPETGERREYRI